MSCSVTGRTKVCLTVMQGLEPFVKACDGKTQDKRALVHAASGGVGTVAVQYLKHVLGCHVTATCSASAAELVTSLGADAIIDYGAERFEDHVHDLDVIFDVLPYKYEARSLVRGVLRRNGHYVHVASSDMSLRPGDSGTDKLGMAIPEARVGYMAGLMYKWLRRCDSSPGCWVPGRAQRR